MRRTITLLAATLVVAAGITSSASAATLYTNSSHLHPVPVGTTFSATGVNWLLLNSAGVTFIGCGGVNGIDFQVTQNSGGVFAASVVQQRFTACSYPMGATSGGSFQISGSSITVGSNKAWLATTMSGTLHAGAGPVWTENLTSATGNPPVNGVYTQQPTSGSSPVSIVFEHAPSVTGSGITGFDTVSATYTTVGSYSLG